MPSSLPSSGPPGSSSQDGPGCTIRTGSLSTPGALTPTSYIVLGLLAFAGEATPYELKAGHAGSVGSFWSVPHSQLYAEPDRLAGAGLVSVRREDGGRRRKHYALTDAGRAALRDWLADAGTPPAEFREPALLKLFFGADPSAVAPAQLDQHRARLQRYEALRAALPGSDGPALTLDAGIEHERVWIAYWERLAAARADGAQARRRAARARRRLAPPTKGARPWRTSIGASC